MKSRQLFNQKKLHLHKYDKNLPSQSFYTNLVQPSDKRTTVIIEMSEPDCGVQEEERADGTLMRKPQRKKPP